jgi:tripartite-type tricarboxylate transporter receptor subunit TctC
MRAIAVASPQRSTLLPNVPSAAESGLPDYGVEFWWGLMAPAQVPNDIVRRINNEVNAVLGEADTRESLLRLAAVPSALSPEEFGRVNAFEVERWGRLMRDANIRVE